MKFQMQVREVGKVDAPTFTEYYDELDIETQEEAEQYCNEIITEFNSNHRYPTEPDREIVPDSVKITGPSDPVDEDEDDDWEDDEEEDEYPDLDEDEEDLEEED